jgi:hypothetical protein
MVWLCQMMARSSVATAWPQDVGKIFQHQLVTSTIGRDVPSETPSGQAFPCRRGLRDSPIRGPQSLRNGEKSVVVRNTRLTPT